jgi:hepatocyte nuclear factor 4-gamma
MPVSKRSSSSTTVCLRSFSILVFIQSTLILDNKSLSDPTRVKDLRKRIQVNLETYINQQKPLMRGRFGELLLLMPPLQNIARLMVDLVARYNQDTKQVDDLINEMLLSK